VEKELVIQKTKYINDRSYIALTVMAQNQQQKYIELLTEKDAAVANEEMANKLINEYLPSIEKIMAVLTTMEEEAADFTNDLQKLYRAALKLAYILRVRFGTLLDFLAGEEEDGAKVNALLGQTFFDFHNTVLEFNNLYALIVKGEGTYNLNLESVALVQNGMTYWEISDVLRMPCSVNKGDTYYWTDEAANLTLVVNFDEEGEACHVHYNQ
jgi:hypothetical protein